MFSALGSGFYLIISRYLGTLKIIYTSFFFLFISGITVILFGHMGPFIFAVTLLPGTIGATLIRAPSSNLLLEQMDENAGAASSMMTFSFAFVGSLCMQFISLDWSSRIFVMGLFYVIAGLGNFLVWPFVYRKCKRID
jgi:DHA1 family bicyclomycin/chloramphenicol resistance-like MFS transporter